MVAKFFHYHEPRNKKWFCSWRVSSDPLWIMSGRTRVASAHQQAPSPSQLSVLRLITGGAQPLRTLRTFRCCCSVVIGFVFLLLPFLCVCFVSFCCFCLCRVAGVPPHNMPFWLTGTGKTANAVSFFFLKGDRKFSWERYPPYTKHSNILIIKDKK